MPNVELTRAKLSSWRKIALGSWRAPSSPSVYGALEIDATKILARQKNWSGAKKPSITAIVAKATAITLHRHPELNGLIRFGTIYRRKHVTLFLQAAVDDAGHELSGVTIENAERKSLAEIVSELADKAQAIRQNKDPNFKKAKSVFGNVPPLFMHCVLDFMSFLLYTLNLDLRWAGLPRDPFGSVMITSIGSLGLDEAFGPLINYSRVPLLLAVGAVRERPVAVAGSLGIAPICKVCVTFDHRFVDGVLAAKMVRTFRGLLESDEGLDELGLK